MKIYSISRHEFNGDQLTLLRKAGINTSTPNRDVDVFSDKEVTKLFREIKFSGYTHVFGVHPIIAMKAKEWGLKFVLFNNLQRMENDKRIFGCSLMRIYNASNNSYDQYDL